MEFGVYTGARSDRVFGEYFDTAHCTSAPGARSEHGGVAIN
jgi:hypothetical protein